MKKRVFDIIDRATASSARCGRIHTEHGIIQTPCFAPVATQATVKALASEDLLDYGTQMILANA